MSGTGNKGYVHSREYRVPFVEAYGSGPYICAFCQNTMETLEVVHHVDEDRTNNELDNLEPIHTTCHNRHHHLGLKHSEETKLIIGESMFSVWSNEEAASTRRQSIAAKNKENWTGRKHTDESREKMRGPRKNIGQDGTEDGAEI